MTDLYNSAYLGHGTPVLLYDGTVKAVEQLVTGDVLIGLGGTRRYITATSLEQGLLYRVIPSHGPSWICSDKHTLTLIGTGYRRGLTVNMSINALMEWTPKRRSYWRLWRSGVDFPTAVQRMEPYLIGLWLGDGSRDRPEITSMDPEVIAYCKELAPRYGLRCVVTDTPSKAKVIRLAGPCGGDMSTRKNVVHDAVRTCVQDGHKSIPSEYLIADRKQRLLLLAGLLDTDGGLQQNYFSITTSVPSLRDSILFLARSLGFAAYATQRQSSIKSCGFVGTYQCIHISGDLFEVPTLIARKRWAPHPNPRRTDSPGFSLDSIGNGAACHFTLDGEGSFLLGDFTVNGLLSRDLRESSKQSRRSVAMHLFVWKAVQKEASRQGMSLIDLVEAALTKFSADRLVHDAVIDKQSPDLKKLGRNRRTARTVSLNTVVYEAAKRDAARRSMSLTTFTEEALIAIGVPMVERLTEEDLGV